MPPEVRLAAEKASFLIIGTVAGTSSRPKRLDSDQEGMGFFYSASSALTCAHVLPLPARKKGQILLAIERGAHSAFLLSLCTVRA